MASRLDIATVLALIVVISSIALTDQSEISWISHSLAGLASMTLMVLAIAFGAMLAQRVKRKRDNILKLHKRTSIYFSSFILGAFF
jgi:predicted permease